MQHHIFRIALCAILLLIGSSSIAVSGAKQNEFGHLSLSDLMSIEVETASRGKQHIRLAPGSIHVVAHDEIQRKGYNYLYEVLQSIPQLQVHQRSGTAYYSAVAIRGISSANRFHILINGNKVNNTDGVFARVMYQYPISQVEYIEVNLTPSSTLYGADAFSGVVNIVTKRNSDNMWVMGGYGMFQTMIGSLATDIELGEARLSIVADYFDSEEANIPKYYPEFASWYFDKYLTDSLMEGFGEPIKVDRVEEFSAPNTGMSFSATLYNQNNELGVYLYRARHSSSTPYEPARNIARDDVFLENTLISSYLRNTMRLTNNVSIESSLEWQRSELSPESNFVNLFSGYNKGYKYEETNDLFLQSQVDWTVSTLSRLSFGLEQRFVTAIPYTSDLPKPYDPDIATSEQSLYYIGSEVYDKDSTFLGIKQNIYTYEKQVSSLFVQYAFTQADEFNATVGARFDMSSKYGNILNPRVGVAWMPDSSLSFKLNASRSYQDPSSQETYRHYGSFYPVIDSSIVVDPDNGVYNQITGLGSGFWHLPNPDLQREIIDNLTFSVAFVPSENLVVQAEVFVNSLTDLIVPNYASDVEFEGVIIQTVERGNNAAEATTYGGSVFGSYLNRISDNVHLHADVSYDFVQGDYHGDKLVAVASHAVKFSVGTELWNAIVVSFDGRYLSESFSQSTSDDKPRIDPSFVLNNSIRVQVMKSLAFRIKTTNILDARYFGPVWQSSSTKAPQDPLRVVGGIELIL